MHRSEHHSHLLRPWKEKKGVIGGYCCPPCCTIAKLQLSVVIVNLLLNPRRERHVRFSLCCHSKGFNSVPWCICWCPVMLFSVLMYAGTDRKSDFRAMPTFACFHHHWRHFPLCPEPLVSPGAARIRLVRSCLRGEEAMAAVTHP